MMQNLEQIKNEVIDDNDEFNKAQKLTILHWIQNAFDYGFAKGYYQRGDDCGVLDANDVDPASEDDE